MSPNTQLENEKRLRREIANSNERRRMQSINTGFQSLKILIPHSCGEKLSKVSFNTSVILNFEMKRTGGIAGEIIRKSIFKLILLSF